MGRYVHVCPPTWLFGGPPLEYSYTHHEAHATLDPFDVTAYGGFIIREVHEIAACLLG